jgi:hypothetical protein
MSADSIVRDGLARIATLELGKTLASAVAEAIRCSP